MILIKLHLNAAYFDAPWCSNGTQFLKNTILNNVLSTGLKFLLLCTFKALQANGIGQDFQTFQL